jgi:hypothetical protein
VQTPAYLDRRWHIPGLGLAAALAAAGCVADFSSLLEPSCTTDEECPPPPGASPCIDARCQDGTCTFGLRVCNDGNPCTSGSCDVDTDACVFQDLPDGTECEANALCGAGTCTCIDGFDDCDDEPGCEAHLASDPKHCHRCDFECAPGQSCINAVCGTCTYDEDCDDSRSCTANLCGGSGECSNPILQNACLISGQCRTDRQRNPSDQCQACLPGTSQSSWTTLPNGETCDDGDPCTIDDRCEEGRCFGKVQDDCAGICAFPNCRGESGECRSVGLSECVNAFGACCNYLVMDCLCIG